MGRTVYRDQNNQVRCVNYGGKKAVEYNYNNLPGLTFAKEKFEVGAVIGKKFHGFDTIPNTESYLPNTENFHYGVLKEFFKEINQIKSLDKLLQETYSEGKKQNNFIHTITEEYVASKKREVPPEFYERTFIEKINFLQNEINHDAGSEKITPPIFDLDTPEKIKVRTQLHNTDHQIMSIARCNPIVASNYGHILFENMIGKRTMENSRLFAETNLFEGKTKILLGTFFLENLLDKTIAETKTVMKDAPLDESNETVMMRYNRDGSQDHEFPELPVFSRVLVHELGHVHQFRMLLQANSPYELHKVYLNLAARMAKKDQFLSVPKKLKAEIKSQILEPAMSVFEYSAESYFVDAVPCIL